MDNGIGIAVLIPADLDAAALGAGSTGIDVLDAFRPHDPADLKVHNPAYFVP